VTKTSPAFATECGYWCGQSTCIEGNIIQISLSQFLCQQCWPVPWELL